MQMKISPSDPAFLLSAKIRSYLLYPKEDAESERMRARLAFYLQSLDKNNKMKRIEKYFTPARLAILNEAPPVSYLTDFFAKRWANQMYTVWILMRLLTSGEVHKANQMKLSLALDIYSNKYRKKEDVASKEKMKAREEGREIEKAEKNVKRPSSFDSTKSQWYALWPSAHLCAAWKSCSPLKKNDDAKLKQRLIKFLAIADKFYQLNKEGPDRYRSDGLLSPLSAWQIPSSFDLPDVGLEGLGVFAKDKLSRLCEKYGQLE